MPSTGDGTCRLSSHSLSGIQSNGFGIGAVGSTGVSDIWAILGERTSIARSTR
ncbi:MAG: hypothetical protein ACM3NW_02570 [Syntrophomonadaceae bacterium]